MAEIKKAGAADASLRENQKKWGKELVDAGWTFVPNMLFYRQRALGLDSLDINILLQLLSCWWKVDRLPYPSKQRIAEAIGCDQSTVRRRIKKMEAGGLIKRVVQPVPGDRHKPNIYDFRGLVRELTPYAKEEIEARTDSAVAARNRLSRKGKPKLKIVRKDT